MAALGIFFFGLSFHFTATLFLGFEVLKVGLRTFRSEGLEPNYPGLRLVLQGTGLSAPGLWDG